MSLARTKGRISPVGVFFNSASSLSHFSFCDLQHCRVDHDGTPRLFCLPRPASTDCRNRNNSQRTQRIKGFLTFRAFSADQAEYFGGSFFKLTHYHLLTERTKEEQCSSYVLTSGGRNVEDVRGRGCGAGVNHAFRRDNRDLGAADSSALRPAAAGVGPERGRGGSQEQVGEKRDGGLKSPAPRGQFAPEASPSRGESAFEGRSRSLKPQ